MISDCFLSDILHMHRRNPGMCCANPDWLYANVDWSDVCAFTGGEHTHNNGSNPALFSLTGSWMFSRTYNNQNRSTHRKHTSGVWWVQTASRISSCLIHHKADLEVRLKKVTTVLCHLSGSVVLFTLMSCGFPTVLSFGSRQALELLLCSSHIIFVPKRLKKPEMF